MHSSRRLCRFHSSGLVALAAFGWMMARNRHSAFAALGSQFDIAVTALPWHKSAPDYPDDEVGHVGHAF